MGLAGLTAEEYLRQSILEPNAFIAPDESYLILSVLGRPDAIGRSDYYVCFRSPDDVWSDPVNLGEAINVPDAQGYSPYVSPDGKYFFFTSRRRGKADIYWITAEIVEDLKD